MNYIMKSKFIFVIVFFYFVSIFSETYSKTNLSFAKDFIIINNKSDFNSSTDELKFKLMNDKAETVFNPQFTHIEIKSFPISGSSFADLDLYPVQTAFDSNTEWFAGTKEGIIKISPPKLYSFKGIIKDQPNSYVFINFVDNQLFSYIKDEDGYVYSITPLYDGSKDNEHILLSHNSAENQNNFICLTDNSQIISNEADDILMNKQDKTLGNNMLELKIACEGSYDFYALMGSDLDKASAYIGAVMTQVSKIYQDNLNVNLLISYVLIWQEKSKDPYRDTDNLFDKLSIMPNLWFNKSVDRAVTCLFADLKNQPPNTTVAGIAFSGSPNYGTLCNKSLGYSVFGISGNGKYPTMNYTWDVNCAAHEIGHNFSSPHTHNCDYFIPPIDTCITGTDPGGISDACIKSGRAKPIFGTLMSYCHLTHHTRSVDLNFHPRCITIMRKAAENARCAYESQSQRVFLVEPLGDKIYKAESDLKIRWRATNVSDVNIKYSLDNGLTWIEIKNRVSAGDREIIWKLPNITAWEVLVLIENSDNPSVNDKSLKTFSIVAPAILLDNPAEGQKFGQRETLNLSWSSYFVESVRIEFSSNAGKNWDVVNDNVIGFTYKWIIPSISSNECKLRFISVTDENVFTESPMFAIGPQMAKIIKPNGGEILCATSTYEIEWISDFVSSIFIEYSVNGGESWQRVTLVSFKPNTNTFTWAVPVKPTKQALLRIYTKPDSIIYLDTCDYFFTIDTCLTGVELTNEYQSSFEWVELIHKSSLKNIVLKYHLKTSMQLITVDLYDLLGKKVANLFKSEYNNPGTYNTEIELPIIADGSYFLVIRSEKENKVFMINIIN